MEVYKCTVCGFLYNKESADRTLEGDIVEFNALDADWGCPNCSISAQMFVPAPQGGLDVDEAAGPEDGIDSED